MFLIQVQQSLISHRKSLRLARLLNVDRYAAIGRLIALWLWCLDNAPDGVLSDDVDDKMLADVMGWPAEMGDSFELVDALHAAGYIASANDETDKRWLLVGRDDLIAHAALPGNMPADAVQGAPQDEPADEEE
jgi:hypothetical protein